MERPNKATVVSLLLIGIGVGLFVASLLELIRPAVPQLDPVSNESIRLEANWFSHRTFRLIMGQQTAVKGMDLKLLQQRNLFARPQQAPEPVPEPEPEVVPEPEPDPPPETKQIEAVYRGFYRNSNGDLLAYIEVEGRTGVFPVGSQIASFWTVVEANVNEVGLRRGKGEKEQLPFNRKKSLEVPIH